MQFAIGTIITLYQLGNAFGRTSQNLTYEESRSFFAVPS